MLICVEVHMEVWTPEISLQCPSSGPIHLIGWLVCLLAGLIFETGSLTEPGSHPFS